MAQISPKPEILFRGVAAAPGIAHGPAFVFFQAGPSIPHYSIPDDAVEAEIKRFESVLVSTHQEISALRDKVAKKLGESEAAIFDAHLLTLDDPALIGETLQLVRETHVNVEHCFNTVAEKYNEVFSKIEDPYFKERAVDIRDVSRRILGHMLGLSRGALSEISDRRVIVSEDLTPSDTASLEVGHAIAIVTDTGNCTSHAVIMSRSLRIPAVVGLMTATKRIAPDDEVLVDGFEGLVYVNPTEETLWHYGKVETAREAFQKKINAGIAFPDTTLDGHPFVLSANVSGAEDIDALLHNHSIGVGLFRTEAVFLKTPNHLPDEEEQFAYYKAVIERCAPARVIVRTLDIGGDKQNSLLQGNPETNKEENPFMGFRAIRICLSRKEIFRTQLRAILRASAFGKVKILLPMISSVEELLDTKEFLAQVQSELKTEGIPFDEKVNLGAMIEIPSAAVCADLLAEHCNFFSIGTNDLVQYLLAVDRSNSRIAHLYEPCNPAVLRVLRDVIRIAKEKRINVGVCGELAGDQTFAPLLYALGADTLSMTPAAIPEIRYLLRHTTRDALDALVSRVFSTQDPKQIKKILRAFASERMV
jgi:phosphotransferase system enzyme I (PtsI)